MDEHVTKRLFLEALELADAEREQFLQRACAGDNDLKRRVEGLLAADERAGLVTQNQQPGADFPYKPLTEAAPEHVGPYRILGVLGEGGFGVVYLAERREPFVLRVALKIIKPGMDSRAVIARFEQERQALAVMNHPNVAKVHDAGTTATGRPYFVMEYVAGEPITDYCDRHRLTLRERLELFVPVCEAVQHAHHKGIIHRDLKPSNILVGVHDGRAAPKVIDFGVAKAVTQTLTDKTVFTATGEMIGTPGYMSPEQAEMGGTDIDTRTDVYSLGAVLYELLAGQLPFDPKTLRSAGYAELQRIIREVEPPRPSTRVSGLGDNDSAVIAGRRRLERSHLALELRRDLDWVPLKALSKDRTERYDSPAELAKDIRNYLDGRPLEAGPQSAAYRLRTLVRRNKGLVAATGAVTAALFLGAVGFAWQAYRIGISRDRAVAAQKAEAAARQAEEKERRKSDAINAFILKALQSSDPRQGGTGDMLVADAMTQALRLLDDEASTNEPGFEAGLRLTIAGVLNGNGRSEEALPVAERGLELLRLVHPGDDLDVARALGVVAECLESLGRATEALPKVRAALEMTQRLFKGDHLAIAESLNNVAFCLENLGRSEEALPMFADGLEMFRRLHKDDNSDVATALTNLAGCLDSLGRYDEAISTYESALAMQQRLHSGSHPDVAREMNNLGGCLQAVGRFDEALPKLRASLEMFQQVFEGDHPDTAVALGNLALCLQSLGRPEEALIGYLQALEMQQRLFEGDHPNLAACLLNLARCLVSLDRPSEALERAQQAADMAARTLPEDHPLRTICRDELAKIKSAIEAAGNTPPSTPPPSPGG